MGITQIWLFSTNKIKALNLSANNNSTHHQTQLIIAVHNCYKNVHSAEEFTYALFFLSNLAFSFSTLPLTVLELGI
jgi:hypothetical protein